MTTAIKSILNPFRRPFTAVTVLGLLVLATVGVKARVWRTSAPAATSQQKSLPTVPKPPFTLATLERSERQASEQLGAATARSDAVARPEGQSSEEQVEVEVITIRANGFDPREITRRHGAFMLAISNHSGATELALQLDRVQGNRVHEVRLPKGRVRWNKVLNLPPGDYVLSEQNHPDWVCRIKLTAR